jgi:peptidoglycan-N-acetylglucosamine deacetylase
VTSAGLLAVSVDLDEIRHYRGIHGMEATVSTPRVYERAVARLADWACERRLPITWFVVGEDLQDSANAEAVASLARRGHELGCHSFSHPYDLTRRHLTEVRSEIEQGISSLERICGEKIRGFRAPGYVVTDPVLELLRECGLLYDSSVFPCPTYYALKAAAVAAIAARGGSSRAIIDVPDVLRAPSAPYRVGRPYWYRGTGIWEVPIQVTRKARLPFIGTSLTTAGVLGARWLANGVVGEPLVNLELHGIDVLDETDGLQDLAKNQRDLRIPWHKKLDAIDAAVNVLLRRGYAGVRMVELGARARAAG